MFKIAEVTVTGLRTVSTFESFAAAVAHAKATFPIEVFEMDGEEAADFFTALGSVYAIQHV